MESHFPQVDLNASRHAREAVVDDMHRLISDAEMLLKATAHDVSDKVQLARERMNEALEDARASCAVMTARTDDTIRANPYKAIGIAAGVGFLLGYLYSERQ